MRIRRVIIIVTSLLLAMAFSASAAAQSATPTSAPAPAAGAQGASKTLTLTGSFGYLFARTTGTGGDQIPAGWIAGIEGVFNGKYAGVAEFAGSFQTAHTYRTTLGGFRFVLPKTGTVTPFVQILAGKGRSSAAGDGVSAFTLQPGVGVDLAGKGHVGFRLQGDYDWRHRATGNVNGFRFAASIVIR